MNSRSANVGVELAYATVAVLVTPSLMSTVCVAGDGT
jgi:hypothetical protein